MPQVAVKQKVVDLMTGSISYIKRTFKIDENSPENSIEYHKIADLVGLNAFDRLNPHISTKLALIYNWAANATKSNDVNKIYSHIDKCRKASGTMEVGKGLVEGLYRTARFDMQSANYEQQMKVNEEAGRAINKNLRGDKKEAESLRNQSGTLGNEISRDSQKVKRLTDKSYRDFEKGLLKEKEVKVRTVEQEPAVSVEV